jgi:PAS domain S-box-containing protein
MQDQNKKKQELIEELVSLRQKVAELERLNSGCRNAEERFCAVNGCLLNLGNNAGDNIRCLTAHTDRRRAEEKLRASEAKYRFLTDKMNDVIWTMDMNFRMVYVSPSIEKLLGFSPEEDLSRDIDEKVTPASMSIIQDVIARELALEQEGKADPERTINVETEYYHKNDGTRWFENVISGIRNEQGILTGIHGVARDITKRKGVEKTLRESEQRMRLALEGTDQGLWDIDLLTKKINYGANWQIILGYGPEESNFDYEWWMNQMHPESRPVFEKALLDYMSGHTKYFDWEYQIRDKSGKWQWVHALGIFTETDKTGFPVKMIGTHRNITAHKKAEEKLKESENKYRDLAELLPQAIFEADLDGKLTFVNKIGVEMFNYPLDDRTAKNVFNMIAPQDRDIVTKRVVEIMGGKHVLGNELMAIRKDGTQFPVIIYASPILREDRVVGMRGTLIDITERKRMEEELLRVQKLESLGVLAGGIAHDFNNLMAIVQGYIDLALMDMPSDHVSRKRLQTAMRSIDQARDLTSRLITFSRGGGPLREPCDVAEIIRDAVQRTVKGTEVRITFDFMEDPWPTEADELQMKQVFYNLTKNAVEAMQEGGNLTIQAENVLIPAGEVPDLKEGSYLKIIFTDEGVGIPEAHLPKVFDPYFTTKKMGAQKGLGLGLAVCYSVLKNHDGYITVKSRQGKGASFVFYLPARPDLAKGKEVKKALSSGTVRVLIMDDEPHIRVIERAYLERMGYEVTDVRDGQEAIDTYRNALQSGTPFDLVMLDLTVRQGMGGQMAMERLLKIDPSIKAIIASGYVDDPVIKNYGDYGFLGAITKPFEREAMKYLVEKIQHV